MAKTPQSENTGPLWWRNERRKLADLIPWPKNPRQIKGDSVRRLQESLAEFNQVELIAVGPGGEVYNGHQRLKAWAAKYGKNLEVEVRVASRPLTEHEREKLTVYLHKGAAGEWDYDLLANHFDPTDLLEWGFSPEELGGIGIDQDATGEDPGPQVDRAAELQEKWGVQPGQLWILGEHRLICGDCTDPAVVDRVMGGESATIMFTSPPYLEQRQYRGTLTGSWHHLMQGCCSAIPADENTQVFVNLGMIYEKGQWIPYWDDWLTWMEATGWRRFGWYVWDQGPGLPGDWAGRFAPSHEFVFHFNKKAKKPNKTKKTRFGGHINHGSGLRNKSNIVTKYSHSGKPIQRIKIGDSVIRIERGETSILFDDNESVGDSVIRVVRHKARNIEVIHPAVFPVDLVVEFQQAWTQERDVVFDPFCGSGTTLIACEQHNRCGRAIELEPAYVAVILERWSIMTGQTPVLESAS